MQDKFTTGKNNQSTGKRFIKKPYSEPPIGSRRGGEDGCREAMTEEQFNELRDLGYRGGAYLLFYEAEIEIAARRQRYDAALGASRLHRRRAGRA